MKKIDWLYIMFSLTLIIVVPLFAQETQEDKNKALAPKEEVTPVQWADEGVVTGKVTALDVDKGSITIKAEGIEKTFSVVKGETILWRGVEDIELSDVNQGEETEVGYYTDESGNLVASWVDVSVEKEAVPVKTDLGKQEEVPPQK